MSRPIPRKSSLAGSSPVAPPPTPLATDLFEPPVTPTKRKPGPRPKVSFYQDPEDTARVRGAILHTMALEGPLTLSQFIDNAVMVEVRRLEDKYNQGKPFPPVAPGGIPQGRPMGE